MALAAGVGLVAVVAYRVHLLLCFVRVYRSLQIVAVAAVLFMVAIHTFEPKQVNVFFVLKRHNRAGLVRRLEYPLRRHRDDRVGHAQDVCGVDPVGGWPFT